MKVFKFLAIFALMVSISIIALKTNDSAIKKDIEDSISSTNSLKGTTVDVQNGIVTLSGTLKNVKYKFLAEKIAKRTKGVAVVVNKIASN